MPHLLSVLRPVTLGSKAVRPRRSWLRALPFAYLVASSAGYTAESDTLNEKLSTIDAFLARENCAGAQQRAEVLASEFPSSPAPWLRMARARVCSGDGRGARDATAEYLKRGGDPSAVAPIESVLARWPFRYEVRTSEGVLQHGAVESGIVNVDLKMYLPLPEAPEVRVTGSLPQIPESKRFLTQQVTLDPARHPAVAAWRAIEKERPSATVRTTVGGVLGTIGVSALITSCVFAQTSANADRAAMAITNPAEGEAYYAADKQRRLGARVAVGTSISGALLVAAGVALPYEALTKSAKLRAAYREALTTPVHPLTILTAP